MAKKKKSGNAGGNAGGESSAPRDPPSTTTTTGLTPSSEAPPQPSKAYGMKTAMSSGDGMPLIICRNKHWRYISSFHGPWLQLPLEGLESLAHSNYNSPRPRPIDAGVFFDLVKIRRLVGEATPLTVNAANGLGPGTMKLSHERKHRMRDQATKRLSQAYHIDEIATSVVIMQGTTSLETVAELVLDKKADDPDAKYVHFFHEKIPSRHVVESTPFDPLNDIIAARPVEPEPLRTRAVLRIFAEDFEGAIADLTSAVQLMRYHRPAHNVRDEIVGLPSTAAGGAARRTHEIRLTEEEQPTSLEMQLLFLRGGAYLSRASQLVDAALGSSDKSNRAEKDTGRTGGEPQGGDSHQTRPPQANGGGQPVDGAEGGGNEQSLTTPVPPATPTPAELEARRRQAEARKTMKTNAKRALRDFTNFLDHLEYSPDFPLEDYDEFARKNGRSGQRHRDHINVAAEAYTHTLYKLSTLFEAAPPLQLPSYPTDWLNAEEQLQQQASHLALQETAHPPSTVPIEYITYHPLMTDALHAVLLCHALLGTSTKELQRHAYMVARLTRVADGYPIFQSSRSPARADWIEILRRVGGPDWLSLEGTWEALCRPASLPMPPGSSSNINANTPPSSGPANRALEGPDKPLPETPFSPSSTDAPQQAETKTGTSLVVSGGPEIIGTSVSGGKQLTARRWAQSQDDDMRDYPIVTERADSIAKWVRESPSLPPLASAGGGGKKKKKPAAKSPFAAATATSAVPSPGEEGEDALQPAVGS